MSQDEGRRSRGFTLIEIMAVVLIIGLLSSIVGLAIFQQVDKGRVTATRAQLANLEGVLELYRMDNARYPTSDQGLEALVRRPSIGPDPRSYPSEGYLRKKGSLVDPWGQPYQYESPGQHNLHSFDLWSLGADGEPDGTDLDADIGNWDEDHQ